MFKFLRIPTTLLLLALIAYDGAAQNFRRKVEEPKHYELATTSPKVSSEIITHKGFTVSYNPQLLIPNWVAWELTPQEASAEDVSRQGEVFQRDPKARGAQPLDSDYRQSGFDRGHMAPAADMRWDQQAMTESFYFTNICPQVKEVNEGKWLELEQKCRWWAKKYKTPVYIVCGPFFATDQARYIGENEVVVPDAFFKCVLQQRDGRWCAAGFVFINLENQANAESIVYPVKVLEIITGHKFFINSDAEMQVALQRANKEDWEIPGWKSQK